MAGDAASASSLVLTALSSSGPTPAVPPTSTLLPGSAVAKPNISQQASQAIPALAMSFNPFILQFHRLEMSDSEYSSDEDDSGESQNNEQTYRVSDLPTVLSNKTATPQVRREQMGNRRSETGAAQKVAVGPHRLLESQVDQNNGSLRH